MCLPGNLSRRAFAYVLTLLAVVVAPAVLRAADDVVVAGSMAAAESAPSKPVQEAPAAETAEEEE